MDRYEKHKQKMNSRVVVALVAGILILINILSVRHFFRFDWTRSGQFTLSESTKELVSGLDDIVTVTAYFSEDLPPTVEHIRRYVKDILGEYGAFSKGRVDFTFVDPATDTNAANEAFQYGVQELRLQIREKDKYEAVNGYMGLVIQYAGKSEVIPSVQNLATLEYDITSRILKVAAERQQVVGFLSGYGAHSIGNGGFDAGSAGLDEYSALGEELRKNFIVENVDLSDGSPITTDSLIVAGPRQAYPQRVLFEIDQFIMNGGNVLFLVDMVNNTDGLRVVELADVNVNSILESYGVRVATNMVLDTVSEFASFSDGSTGMSFFVQYPPIIKLIRQNFGDNSIVRDIESFPLRWASSLELTEKEGITSTLLASSSAGAWEQKDGAYQLDPQQLQSEAPAERSQFPMAALQVGFFESAFAKSDIPAMEFADGTILALEDDKGLDREVLAEAKDEAMIVVVGESDFLTNNALRGGSGGAVFFLNAVDFLTLGDTLISIRSKNLNDAPLEEVSESVKTLYKFLGVGLMPVLFCLYGFFRLHLRRREEQMSSR